MTGAVHKALLNEAYAMFSITNPMHSDVFPSVRRMEGEVVAMTASILGGGRGEAGGASMPRVQGLAQEGGAAAAVGRGKPSCLGWLPASTARLLHLRLASDP